MKIGIGITTMEGIRQDLKDFCHSKFMQNSPFFGIDKPQLLMITIEDKISGRKGIAKSKNELLRALSDCDHIFLFDDDCWPISPDWYKVFIDSAKAAKQEHLMYLPNKGNKMGNLSKEVQGMPFGDLLYYPYGWGCMQYYTRECIEIAGGYNEEFEIYGYEHLELSMRIYNMGLTSFPYMTINDVTKYIYSCDFEGFPEGLKPEKHSLDGLDMKPILAKNFALFERNYKKDKKIPL